MSRPEWVWLGSQLARRKAEPFEHDSVQLACDNSVDDDEADRLDYLGHIEG